MQKNKNCLILSLIVIILSGILYWLNDNTIREAYGNCNASGSASGNENDIIHMREKKTNIDYLESKTNPSLIDTIQISSFDPSVFDNDQTIVNNQKNSIMNQDGDYTINDISTDIMNDNPNQSIQWNNVYIDDSNATALTIVPLTAAAPDDLYSQKKMLDSNFKEDICVTYAGDHVTINKKCQELDAENCKIPSCCVLLNGTKCVAGNSNGPFFLTKNGVASDQQYYYNKNKCYGNCSMAQQYETACGVYANDSTNISKSCMIHMFNQNGCPNPKPDALINDTMVQSFSQTSKQYVAQYIQKAVNIIFEKNDGNSKLLCYG
jgi:hypothetical protein